MDPAQAAEAAAAAAGAGAGAGPGPVACAPQKGTWMRRGELSELSGARPCLKHALAVEAVGAGQVRHPWVQQHVRLEAGSHTPPLFGLTCLEQYLWDPLGVQGSYSDKNGSG